MSEDAAAPAARPGTVANLVKLFVSLAVGGVCLVLAFRGIASTDEQTGVPWKAIGATMRGTAWWGYVGWTLLLAVQILLRTQRWRIQVRGLTGAMPSVRESLAINCVSFAAVFLLPFRLGELVRPNMVAERKIMSRSAGLAATFLERSIDGIVTTGFFGLVLVLMGHREVPEAVRVGGWTAVCVFGGALTFFFVAFRWREGTARVFERVVGLVHGALARKLGALLRGFLDGLACFEKPGDLAGYVACTVAYWFTNGLGMLLLLRAMHIETEALAAFFTLCFLVIGVMIPAPPGNVGNFHAFARAGLAVFAVPPAAAIGYAILLHLLTVGGIVLAAAVFFVSGDVSLARIRRATAAPPPAGPSPVGPAPAGPTPAGPS